MGRTIRMYGSEGIYFVTARVTQGRLLMRPSVMANEVIGGILARACRHFGVKLRGFIFMSNHLHLLVRAQGRVLSQFMQFLLGNIARKVGRLHGWSGPFWQRRFSCEPVLDPEAELGRLRYILSHGVKEALVARPSEWPGLSCLKALLAQDESYPFYNWDWRWNRPGLRGLDPWNRRLVEQEVLVVEPIGAWREYSPQRRAEVVGALVDQIAAQYWRPEVKVLGAAAVLKQNPHKRVPLERRSHRPLCHVSSVLVWTQWMDLHRAFLAAYFVASKAFRGGQRTVEFPQWAFLPPDARASEPPKPQPTASGSPEPGSKAGVPVHVFHPRDRDGSVAAGALGE